MIDQRIKFRHLNCFLEIARQKRIALAADVLAISQPAVSKTLRELEEILETKLFERTRRGVTLTTNGELFHKFASSSITSLRQGFDSIKLARMKGQSALTIGVLPTVAASMMPNAVKKFKQQNTETTIRIITGPNTVLLGRLRVGELDLVVGRLADADQMAGLFFSHLYSENITFAVRPHHPLLGNNSFDIQDIVNYTVMLPTRESIIRPTVDRFLIANGIGDIPDRIETVSNAFGRQYTRKSDAIWIISNGVVRTDYDDGELVRLPIKPADTQGPVGLTTRHDAPTIAELDILMDLIRDVSRQMHPD
jgi:LysR family transcriptional regulator, pca operon transcriptional activator